MNIDGEPLESDVENILSPSNPAETWSEEAEKLNNIHNNTLLYISVNYEKKSKPLSTATISTTSTITNEQQSQISHETFADFIRSDEVSPLDPNMSSVAQYSPTHVTQHDSIITTAASVAITSTITDTATNNNYNSDSIVIQQQQYDISNGRNNEVENEIHKDVNLTIDDIESVNISNVDSSNNIPTILCSNNNELRNLTDDNHLFEMIGNEKLSLNNQGDLQIVPDGEHGVKLLITDRTTGISYSVNTQELLIEHCLDDDQRLLESIAPDTILESDLLTLDDSTLRTELNNTGSNSGSSSNLITAAVPSTITETSTTTSAIGTCPDDVSNEEELIIGDYINNCLTNEEIDQEIMLSNRLTTRSMSNSGNGKSEEEILGCVYNIIDRPILTRARATLPESYLAIGNIDDEPAIFARKSIPKRSRFGPLQGQLYPKDSYKLKTEDNSYFLVDLDGITFVLDTSDEHVANWMSFVRWAVTYEEQNVIVFQAGNELYFITTKLISPKEELKVGYGLTYANHFNLEVLKPVVKNTWPCYECSDSFPSSEELQKHLNIHDQWKTENNIKPKRIYRRKLLLLKTSQLDIVECNQCKEPFEPNVNCRTLYKHLNDKHKDCAAGVKINEFFSIHPVYECNYCQMRFRTEILLKIHKLEHDPELSLEQNNHVCPQCQRKFPTRRQLVLHVANYSLSLKIKKDDSVRCGLCYKLFACKERLQKHMLVHGSDDQKPMQCKICERRFLTNSALSGHLKVHFIGQKNFECPICKERFEHVLKLKMHVPKHAQNNQYTCPHCKKIFKKYSVIRKHIRAFHSERKFDCLQCSKIFSTVDHLKKHMLKHSDHKEFLCSDCGKQFKRRDKLFDHVKKMHVEARKVPEVVKKKKKFLPSVEPTDFHRFIYKCHNCLVGFKRRGMLVNHLAKRHPDIPPDSVPELNLPILQTTKNYYCQYCDKVYKSSSKRKMHILKNHPGSALPVNSRQQGSSNNLPNGGATNQTFAQTVGSVTTRPKQCQWCHKQYASKAKLLQHVRKEHAANQADMDSQINDNNDESLFSNNFLNDDKLDKIVEEAPASPLPPPPSSQSSSLLLTNTKPLATNRFIVTLKQEDDGGETSTGGGGEIPLNQNHITTDGNIMEITMDGCIDNAFNINEANGKFCNLSIDGGDNDDVVNEAGSLLIVNRNALESQNSQLYQLLNGSSNCMLPSR